MAETTINDWLMKGTDRFVKMQMASMFSNIMNRCSPKTSGIFCRFGCPGSQDNTSLLELLVFVVNLVFSGVLRGAGGRHV